MKKLVTLIGVLVIAAFLFSGCGKKTSADIVVADLETACDCVDAMTIILEETKGYLTEMQKYENMDEAKQIGSAKKITELVTKMMILGEKTIAVESHCAQFDEKDLEDCSNYNKAIKLMDEVDDLTNLY